MFISFSEVKEISIQKSDNTLGIPYVNILITCHDGTSQEIEFFGVEDNELPIVIN